MTNKRWIQLVLLASLGLVAASCGLVSEDGSGTAETTTFDLDGFDQVEVGGAFEFEISVVDGPFSIDITVDDNLVDDLDIKVRNSTLHVGFDNGSRHPKVTPTAVIQLPSLVGLDVSGASTGTAVDIVSDSFTLDLSGASELALTGTLGRFSVDASGASDLVVTGEVGASEIDASGASSIDLSNAPAGSIDLDASGASDVSLGDSGDVRGDLSGASTLEVPEQTSVSVELSGASTVDRRR